MDVRRPARTHRRKSEQSQADNLRLLAFVDLAGTHSNRTDIVQDFAELQKQTERSGPYTPMPPRPSRPGVRKKQFGSDEVAEIIGKYIAGASMAELTVEHHMAKR
ncbi:hypothetical protein [Nocardia sp. N2S4-5]|uniref:hypothetical protein n=1 Tax=Nocardia sp. N2S4-5 TaxID=3351565 RepID=UPI0037D585D6